jgi:hypothetical protein
VIQTGPGGYTETHEGPEGQYKVKSNGIDTKSVYEGDGVKAKESTNGVVTKGVYDDGHCQQKTVSNAASGKSKTVTDCD